MYAVSVENEEYGAVEYMTPVFADAVYKASKLFGASICSYNQFELVELHYSDTEFIRVDVFECSSEEDADRQFADALFVPLFHLDSGMNFWG